MENSVSELDKKDVDQAEAFVKAFSDAVNNMCYPNELVAQKVVESFIRRPQNITTEYGSHVIHCYYRRLGEYYEVHPNYFDARNEESVKWLKEVSKITGLFQQFEVYMTNPSYSELIDIIKKQNKSSKFQNITVYDERHDEWHAVSKIEIADDTQDVVLDPGSIVLIIGVD